MSGPPRDPETAWLDEVRRFRAVARRLASPLPDLERALAAEEGLARLATEDPAALPLLAFAPFSALPGGAAGVSPAEQRPDGRSSGGGRAPAPPASPHRRSAPADRPAKPVANRRPEPGPGLGGEAPPGVAASVAPAAERREPALPVFPLRPRGTTAPAREERKGSPRPVGATSGQDPGRSFNDVILTRGMSGRIWEGERSDSPRNSRQRQDDVPAAAPVREQAPAAGGTSSSFELLDRLADEAMPGKPSIDMPAAAPFGERVARVGESEGRGSFELLDRLADDVLSARPEASGKLIPASFSGGAAERRPHPQPLSHLPPTPPPGEGRQEEASVAGSFSPLPGIGRVGNGRGAGGEGALALPKSSFPEAGVQAVPFAPTEPTETTFPVAALDSEALADLVNEALIEQARRNGVDLS